MWINYKIINKSKRNYSKRQTIMKQRFKILRGSWSCEGRVIRDMRICWKRNKI